MNTTIFSPNRYVFHDKFYVQNWGSRYQPKIKFQRRIVCLHHVNKTVDPFYSCHVTMNTTIFSPNRYVFHDKFYVQNWGSRYQPKIKFQRRIVCLHHVNKTTEEILIKLDRTVKYNYFLKHWFFISDTHRMHSDIVHKLLSNVEDVWKFNPQIYLKLVLDCEFYHKFYHK